ncbi:YheC/YheD family protein [Bacillus carboniphilus]|uniref:YheC/YheD family protein n=1 Tax=Bacillus carboniphilus TaxID=86663 RepID=A0ABY9JTU2_9BACI|nr:YheC/YheD family protein [Bacillus carboniphilus]WLR42805.1 YheC/YheD family protein [Bacillus carboniphilus]
MDFRILCHQRQLHKWTITSSIARVSAENQIVSNLAQGGQLYKTSTLLNTLFDEKKAYHIRKLLHEVASEIVYAISQNAEGIYAELGVDLAIDEDGKPWVIEVNTKPSKLTEMANHQSRIRPSAKAIIDTCFLFSSFKER